MLCKSWLGECLGKYVGCYFTSMAVGEFNLSLFNMFLNEVILTVKMLCSGMELRVPG